MSNKETKRKKKRQSAEDNVERQNISELSKTLEKLTKEGKHVDIQICPRCKSPLVNRVGIMSGDMWAHSQFLATPMFECGKCGWRGRLVLMATNRPEEEKG